MPVCVICGGYGALYVDAVDENGNPAGEWYHPFCKGQQSVKESTAREPTTCRSGVSRGSKGYAGRKAYKLQLRQSPFSNGSSWNPSPPFRTWAFVHKVRL